MTEKEERYDWAPPSEEGSDKQDALQASERLKNLE